MKLPSAFLFLPLFFIFCGKVSFAQQYSLSLPEKLQLGVNNYEVLGANSEGVLVLSSGKTIRNISLYATNMKLQWKKGINLKEFGIVNVQKIFLIEDSALVFYTVQSRGVTILKAVKVNQKFEVMRTPCILDTLGNTTLISVPSLSYASSFGKKRITAYYEDLNSTDKRKIHCICIDDLPSLKWKNEFRPPEFAEPQIISVLPDDSLRTWILFGENQVKNFRNDFPFNKFMLITCSDSGKAVFQSMVEESGYLFSSALIRQDRMNRQIVVAGMFSDSPGNESDGVLVSRFSYNSVLLSNKLLKFSDEFLSDLCGNIPPKRNDGFYSFSPSQMILKLDGGIIFLAESYNVSTESYNSAGFGNYGVTSSLTVNFYHYDDVIVLSTDASDSVHWEKVLHKKQQTEGDGGYFSSFFLTVAPTQLILVFNDFSSGMAVLSSFSVGADGAVDRNEIFNADKKGLLPVPQSCKQVSPNEVIMPSIKKGYLQYIKIIF